MGTRSLTKIKDGNGSYLVTIYRQYDGYPEGMGKDLAEFLLPFTIVNGFGIEAKLGSTANGMGCLAAQIVAHLKTDVGNVYLYPRDSKDVGEEFLYEVSLKENALYMKIWEVPYSGDNILLLSGNIEEALHFCNGNDNYDDDEPSITTNLIEE